MHGKGGSPQRLVLELAKGLEAKGFLVANLEMPWSGRRNYDVPVAKGEEEVETALAGLRAKGAKKVFVSGHSQGGVFTLHLAGTGLAGMFGLTDLPMIVQLVVVLPILIQEMVMACGGFL